MIPLYHQLKEILREQIANRTYKPHQQIPSEPELQRMYGLSRATIRKAIDLSLIHICSRPTSLWPHF